MKLPFDWLALVFGMLFIAVGAMALVDPDQLDVGLLVAVGCVAIGGAAALNAFRK
jgi:hypothetical protein